jgi:hypothetical protein
MHGIAGLRATEMGESSQGDDNTRRLGVVERHQDALLGDKRIIVDRLAEAVRFDRLRERAALPMRLERQVAHARSAVHHPRRAAVGDCTDGAAAGRREELYETHVISPS